MTAPLRGGVVESGGVHGKALRNVRLHHNGD